MDTSQKQGDCEHGLQVVEGQKASEVAIGFMGGIFDQYLPQLLRGETVEMPPIFREQYEEFVKKLYARIDDGMFPEEQIPLRHHFAPGVYVREVFMHKGMFVLSREHKTSELNVVTSGSAIVRSGDNLSIVRGPCTFESPAGIFKALWILEDMTYFTVHINPDDCRDIPTLEDRLAWKSELQIQHEKKLLALAGPSCNISPQGGGGEI